MLARSALRIGTVLVFLAAGSLLAAQDLPQPQPRITVMRGWIVDDKDSHKHANADSADAVVKAYEEGSPLLFWGNDGTYFTIDNQEEALSFVGHEWKIVGAIMPDQKLRIGTFIDPTGVEKPQVVGQNVKPPRPLEAPDAGATSGKNPRPNAIAPKGAENPQTPPPSEEAAPSSSAEPEKKDPPSGGDDR